MQRSHLIEVQISGATSSTYGPGPCDGLQAKGAKLVVHARHEKLSVHDRRRRQDAPSGSLTRIRDGKARRSWRHLLNVWVLHSFWEDNISTVYRRCCGLQKRSRWRFFAGGSGPALFRPQFMCRNRTIASGWAEYDEPYEVL